MSSPAPAGSIQVFDKYGREFTIPREQWRTEVLPASLRSNWDDADALYAGIVQALNDGFVAEVADAVARLRSLEPDSARAMTTQGFVLLQSGRVDEAQELLEECVAQHGNDAAALNNLAKVHAERGDTALVEATLWRALQADPNQEHSLGWYEALNRERGGAPAAADALRRVAELPRSWRARTSLARHALDARDVAQAMKLYGEALDMVGAAVPADILMTITGDLGRRGFLAQLLEIGMPRFVPEQHGVQVGNNLIKACVDAGRLDDARAIVEKLFAFDRADWKPTLTFWDAELMKAETARNVQVGPTVEMAMYAIEGPVWAHYGSPVAGLFAPPPEDALRVVFIGSTSDTANAPATPQVQMADAAGRLSRILPLYLAEQAQLRCGARPRALFPWMDNAIGGSFVVTTTPTPDDVAVQRARSGGRCDFVVVTHVKARAEPWSATMRVLRASDGRCVFEHEVGATSDRPDIIAAALAIEIQRALEQQAGLKAHAPAGYLPPAPPHLLSYLLRLEQLLALRCARDAKALHGVREILEGNLHLALDFPQNTAIRALLADVVARMANIRPDVVAQYRDRILLAHRDNPLPEPAQSTLDGMLEAALDGARPAG